MEEMKITKEEAQRRWRATKERKRQRIAIMEARIREKCKELC